MTTIDWENEAEKVDQAVDAYFGEDVDLIPVTKGPMTGFITDPSRPVKTVRGVFLTNEELQEEMVKNQTTPAINVNYGLSLRKIFFAGYKKGDHVLFKKPSREGLRCEIIMPGPSETGRIVLGLIRV